MGRMKEYLDYHKNAWSETTMKAEEARLHKYLHLAETPPASAYAELSKKLKPYTIKTLFIRLGHYQEWLFNQKFKDTPSEYKTFLKSHANKFKHVYDRKPVGTDYHSALRAISTLADSATRFHAEFLLKSGVRISESYSVKDGFVVGKGGKRRKIYVDPPSTLVPQKVLREALSSINLTPHALRKLCATNLARNGADAPTLCKVMGWSSIATAYKYLEPIDDDRIKEMLA